MSKPLSKKQLTTLKIQQSQPLYFDAKRDMNPYWKSSLFSEVYLKNDIPREYSDIWEHDEIADSTSGFSSFYNGFLDLVNKLENSSMENWKEAETVKNWIVPIMVLLGWDTDSKTEDSYYIDNESFSVVDRDRKQTYRPDLIYFDKPKHKTYTQNQTDSDKKLVEVRDNKTGCKIVVEAKYWNRLSLRQTDSKKDKKVDDSAVGLGPELQTLKYMEILNLNFGILTDGKVWRLFHKELSQGVDRRSYDFDLGRLKEIALEVDVYGNEEKYKHYAKYFYYFFAKASFVQGESAKTPFVIQVFNYSKKYALNIEENLKKRFIITMGLTCNALKDSCIDQKEEVNLQIIRSVAESHIFNVLFVKSCEVRQVLPIRSIEYVKVSLHEVIESLDSMRFDPDKDENEFFLDFQHGSTFGGKKFSFDGFQIFERFINLYEIIHDGTVAAKDFGFEIEGFKESIFSKDEWKFAKKHKINNREMIKILFTLNFIESEFSGRKYQQVPYSYFTPRQLGSIYESFLEYRLENAETGMIFHKGQWQKANTKSSHTKNLHLVDSHIVEKGSLFFSPDNEDRKISGSYYTPDYIVKFIVENTLKTTIDKCSSDDILKIKICDPAMGSGHFLAGALDYLVEMYRKKWCEENNDDMSETLEETSRKVLDSCLFGVDINFRAVKLAKMNMWLMTAYPGKKLENLNDQFRTGDTLSNFSLKQQFEKVDKAGGFDFIVGNPPFIGKQKKSEDQKNGMDEIFNNLKDSSSLDYVAAFFPKALGMLKADGQVTFISSSSIVQGEQASILWPYLFKKNVEIKWAISPFMWPRSSATDAVVFVAIISFGLKNSKVKKFLGEHLDNGFHISTSRAEHINQYLVDFKDLDLESRDQAISNVPVAKFGNMPNDGGHFLFTDDEKNAFVKTEPKSLKFFKPFLSAREFLHNEKRWCLWLKDYSVDDLKKIPSIYSRVQEVKKSRLSSTREATKKLALFSNEFGECRQPSSNYILIPCHTSELRSHLPLGFCTADDIVGNSCISVENADLYHFGVLSSSIHNLWLRLIGGRIKNDLRYSIKLVYNNFPWPNETSKENKKRVEAISKKILSLRQTFTDTALAEMYDDETMDKQLLQLHTDLDDVVNDCYGFSRESSNGEKLKKLFEIYNIYILSEKKSKKLVS